MSKQKLTPWFNMNIKPVHIGVYETCFVDDEPDNDWMQYSYWNGKHWCNQWGSIELANANKHMGIQNKIWRGLAVKP